MKSKATQVVLAFALLLASGAGSAQAANSSRPGGQLDFTPYIGQCVSVLASDTIGVAGTLVTATDSYLELDVPDAGPNGETQTAFFFLSKVIIFVPFCI